MAGNSRVARILQRGGGLFLKFDSTVNELDPNFHLVSIGLRQIQSVFLPKSSDLQKKKSSPKFRAFFCQLTPTSTSPFTIFGGAIFVWGGLFPVLGQKPTSKLLKACYFAYCSGQWGGGYSTICPPSYATGWKDARCSQSIFHTTSLR